jgi:hypothetical protein
LFGQNDPEADEGLRSAAEIPAFAGWHEVDVGMTV